jgi:hypothetical protein
VAQKNINAFTGTTFKHTAIQREVLDVIGNALKRRQVDFLTATKLGDRLKVGRAGEVIRTLNRITGSNSKLADLLEYQDA